MSGMSEMVKRRGGIGKLSATLRQKIHRWLFSCNIRVRSVLINSRADLTGAIAFLQPPFFTENSLPKIRDYVMSRQNPKLRTFLATLSITESLRTDFLALDMLSKTLKDIMQNPIVTTMSEQAELMEIVCSLRYSLLCSPVLLQASQDHLTILPGSKIGLNSVLEEVLRLSALLYMSTTLREFPFSTIGSRNLVHRLKERVPFVKIRNGREGELMIWVLVIGWMEAVEKGWWREQLCRLIARLESRGSKIQEVMERLWWVERIHGKRGREVWRDIT